MPRYSTAFGMDVHLRSTTVCALDAETGEAVTRRFRGNPWGEVAEWMSGFPGPSLAAYESGYLGFAPQRELSGLGVDCVVAAVSRVPRSAADLSSKNDRNDAARMAKAILSHDISPVWVPSPEIEGLRDLAGAHDAATARLAAAKQRLLAFLARRGYAYGGTTPAGNPPEVLDVRLPQVARQGPARRRRRHPGAGGADGTRSRRPPRRATTSSPSTGPPSRRAPSRRRSRRSSHQGVRLRARRRLRVRGRRLHEVPFRKAGHGLLRPRPRSRGRARTPCASAGSAGPATPSSGGWPSRGVSVNIIFTISTNAFSPIAPTRIRRIRQRGCAAFGA